MQKTTKGIILLAIVLLNFSISLAHDTYSSYNIYVLGDSSALCNFSDLPEIHPDFYKQSIIKRAICYQNSIINFNCYIKCLWGKTLHGTQKIPFTTLIDPDLASNTDIVCITFGVLDVALHIHQQSMLQHKEYTDLIEELIVPYINNILNLQKTYFSWQKIIIMATVPPQCAHPNFNLLHIRNLLNNSLAIHVQNHNLLFWDPFYLFANENGFLKKEYQGSGLHFKHDKTDEILLAFHHFLVSLL